MSLAFDNDSAKKIPRFLTSWSGGKDSCLAFLEACTGGGAPAALLTMLNETGARSRSHGIPPAILAAQAERLGLPVITGDASWGNYEEIFVKKLIEIKCIRKADTVVFGDIDLAAHREWEEKVCAAAGLNAVLPLWGRDRRHVVRDILAAGIRAMIISCNARLGENFLGRILNEETVRDLDAAGVDVCGENGEYHTLVLDCPRFSRPLEITAGKKERAGDYWFLEVAA